MKVLLLAAALLAPIAAQQTAVKPGLPAGPNTHYPGNRAPLLASPLVKLPVGAVKPGGWLREQLVRMSDGFSGRLPEISQFCKFEDNAWTDTTGKGRFGWEELPYWLKGYIDLGYVLDDKRIIAESTRWVEAVLASQQENGYFGPRTNLTGEHTIGNLQNLDIWPNMVMLFALRTHYDATGDKRVLPFMTRYFKWFQSQPLDRILPSSWQKHRGGDNLDSIYWLYNRTGDAWLLDAARVNHERTSDWVSGIPTWHGVNVSQCFREPGQYYQQTKDIRYLDATERNYSTIRDLYGAAWPGGLWGADENVRPGFRGPRQGAESCTMVELMHSHEMLAAITGDAKWLDRAEEVALNSLPASMTPDLKALHYVTAPNQIQLDRATKAPLIENGGDMMSYNPYQYRCCQHNVAFGWPYYAERLWMATGANGLAATFYSASEVTAKVGASGRIISIAESTGYPFDGTVEFVFQTKGAVRFPLSLRIPEWTRSAEVLVNSTKIELPKPEKGFVTIERQWSGGDRVKLTLGMGVDFRRWEKMGNSASVKYGPLWFSLKIGEKWKPYGDNPQWQASELYPTTDWNYALEVSAPIQVNPRRGEPAAQPWTPDASPLTLTARARKVPEWRQEPNGLIGEIQPSPVLTTQPVEEITLIPLGAARLRLSVFPVAGTAPQATRWDDNPPLFTASSSTHLDFPGVPGSFAFGGHQGTSEWVEQAFSWPKTLSRSEMEWASGAAPESCRILYRDGAEWRPVKIWSQTGGAIEFDPVTAREFRLQVKLMPRRGAKLARWSLSSSAR